MNQAQLITVLERYRNRIETEMGVVPSRFGAPSFLPSKKAALSHVAWMVGELMDQILSGSHPEDPKFHRWLGFVQGVIWLSGIYSLEAMRGD